MYIRIDDVSDTSATQGQHCADDNKARHSSRRLPPRMPCAACGKATLKITRQTRVRGLLSTFPLSPEMKADDRDPLEPPDGCGSSINDDESDPRRTRRADQIPPASEPAG